MLDPGTLRNLLAFVAQTTLIAAVGMAAIELLRLRSAPVRYGALRVVLLLCLALPLVQPRLETVPAAIDLSDLAAGFRPSAPSAAALSRPASWFRADAGGWLLLVGPILVAGAMVRAGWIVLGMLRLRTLRRSGAVAPASVIHEELRALIEAGATIRYVQTLDQPVTFGLIRPVVLLPERLAGMPPHVQRAVTAHELWHVRRRDWAWTMAEETLRAALWFHPVLWLLISRIQSAREEVVDELTVLLTNSRRAYLDALLAFADAPPPFSAAAFARRRHLVRRMRLISKERVMSPRRVVLSGAVLAAALLVCSWQAIEAFPFTAFPQMPRDPVRQEPPPPPPAPPRQTVDEATLLKRIQADPSPVNYLTLATFYWERAYKDRSLTTPERATMTMLGIQATDAALAADPEYAEAMIYKNILLRMQANASVNPEEQRRLIAEADALRERAIEIRKQNPEPRHAPAGDMPPPPPPPPPPPAPATLVDGMIPLRVGGTIKPPTKIKNVNPVYPPEAQAAGVRGVVILETTIDSQGRVRGARIIRSVPSLDQAALDAVHQWEFEPVLLNGAPVPVIMTITVNFTLE